MTGSKPQAYESMEKPYGNCRRYAPVGEGTWPTVGREQWCGEHEPVHPGNDTTGGDHCGNCRFYKEQSAGRED